MTRNRPSAELTFRPPRRPARRGLSLVELLIVVLLLAVLATLALSYVGSTVPDKLQAAAECVIGDLELARSLAVNNASNYRVIFETNAETYYLEHAGTNAALDVLPASPFLKASPDGKRLIGDLADLPSLDGQVELLAVQKETATPTEVPDVEFDQLGSTARTERTVIWLAAGRGSERRYLAVTINPTTGLAEAANPQPAAPTGVTDPLAAVAEATGS